MRAPARLLRPLPPRIVRPLLAVLLSVASLLVHAALAVLRIQPSFRLGRPPPARIVVPLPKIVVRHEIPRFANVTPFCRRYTVFPPLLLSGRFG